MTKQGLTYSGMLVREHDPDRFLLSLFMPKKHQKALWALFAFNYEVAKTREVVSETQLGLIRLQWWREAIQAVYADGDVPKHEILDDLADVIRDYHLLPDYFETLIYAREFDLEDVLPSNTEGMLNYTDFTSTPLFKLALQILGEPDPESLTVHPVALNYALAGLFRAVPFHARQRRCYLPADALAAHDVTPAKLYEGHAGDKIKSVIQTLSGYFEPDVQNTHKFLSLSQYLACMYMNKLENLDFDVFAPKMAVPLYFKEIRLFCKSVLTR